MADWEACYRDGVMPWDAGEPAPHLVRALAGLPVAEWRTRRAIELGCGTGTDALWLAAQGWRVTALDLSAGAIRLATAKMRAGVRNPVFRQADVLRAAELPRGPFDLAFDRGCFHSVPARRRPTFVANVARLLRPGGYWINLSGSEDRPPDEPEGPPRLRAAELVAAVEGLFEIHELRRVRFRDGADGHLAWLGIFCRRR